MYNEGISIAGDILDLATEVGVIKKSGNSYTYPDKKDGDIKLGVGRETAKQFLKDNQKLIKIIRKDVLDAVATKEAAEA
jgi:recombination protein RecA